MSRLAHIAKCLDVPKAVQLGQLAPPNPLPPTLDIHIELTEEYLDNRRIDSKTTNPPSKFASILKTKRQRHKAADRTLKEVFDALEAIVTHHGSSEVAQVLVAQLQSLGGNPNWNPLPKQSLTKRIGSTMKLAPTENKLLQIATRSKQLEIIGVLASWSEVWTLNACLGIAIAADDLAAIELLLRYGADANTTEEEFPLWKAVKEKKLRRVKLQLSAPKPPRGECLSHALLQAVDIGDLPLVQELLARGAEISFKNFAAIEAAVNLSNLEITVAILASDGELPSTQLLDKLVCKVFLIEEQIGHERWCQFLEVLLCAGAKGNATDDCLIQAVMLDSLAIVKLFVHYGASVNHDSAKALEHAISKANLQIINVLLGSDSPPSPTYISAAVTTAMQLDNSVKRLQVMQLLHLAGATGTAINDGLITVARQETIEQPDMQVLELLLQMGADVDCEEGQAIELATFRKNLGLLKRLLGASPSPKTLCRAYNTAIKVSTEARRKIMSLLFKAGMPIQDEVNSSLVTLVKSRPVDYELIELLLANGTSVSFEMVPNSSSELVSRVLLGVFHQTETNVWDTNGLQIMKMLLKKGVWTNTLDEMLPFSIVAAHTLKTKGEDKRSKTMEFVSLLLENEADRNHESGSALQKAAQYGMLDIVELLIDENCSALTLNTAFPYLLSSETVIAEDFVLALIPLFRGSGNGFDRSFRHPKLDPIIILALRRYPESDLLLTALLEAQVQVDEVMLSVDEGFASGGELVTPLLWLIGQPSFSRQSVVIRMLLKYGANANFYTSKSGTTPLLLATKVRNYDIMMILLQSGAHASIGDTADLSVLWYATHNNDNLAISILLKSGAAKNDGSLHEASLRMNLKNIERLCTAGHNLDFPCTQYDGRTPLQEVCINATSTENYSPGQERLLESTIKMLVTRGADLKLRQDGKSLLLLALDSSNPIPCVKVLLRTYIYTHINEVYNLYTENGVTYSPSMYIKKGRCKSPKENHPVLLKLLRGSNGIDVFYNESALLPQPVDMVNAPPHILAAEAQRLADSLAEVKRKKHLLVLREEETLAAAHAADLANKKFLQEKQHQVELAKVMENLGNAAAERRRKVEKEEMEVFQLREARVIKLQKEALENSKRVQMMDAITAKENQRAQQQLIEQEMAHKLRLQKIDQGREERMSSLVSAEQTLLDSIAKQMNKRENMEELSERRLLDEKRSMEERQEQWLQQEKLSAQQKTRIEWQLQQQRAIVRDMERIKEQLNSLRAGGGIRRSLSSFSDESQ